ncbi:addiction module antidote protein [Coralloluteibacterium stylophorae]|uniref:Addiction module antidote protein n=1 Tax=Coralloluteibacterium stylophorae TaxID=1776034 RepID=A0A8J7VSJ3_9GAMM|nr:addiction module antidote protein [Coralloluteibacterium stylophorae]MBS7456766.1 putative addiction module antidote protein [Coralloluteibacterium stylophorae]
MTKTETRPFDAAEFLDTDEAVAAYLQDALESGSAEVFQTALQTAARARGMTEVAKASGLGRESLYKALRPDAHPRFDTVQRVLAALGVKLTAEPAPVARSA